MGIETDTATPASAEELKKREVARARVLSMGVLLHVVRSPRSSIHTLTRIPSNAARKPG
jgi:hypothetical protein